MGWWRWVVLPTAAAAATWFVFQVDVGTHPASDYGPDYSTSSTYGRYRDATHDSDLFVAVVGSAYAMLAGTLVVATLAASRRRDGLYAACAVFACAAVALPAIAPSLLSRGPDATMRFAWGVADPEGSSPPTVKACFYREADPDSPGIPAELGPSPLCLRLEPTLQARALVQPPAAGGNAVRLPPADPSVDDIAAALTDQRLKEGEIPDSVPFDGIEIVDARWGR
jgi:hypothetical protein